MAARPPPPTPPLPSPPRLRRPRLRRRRRQIASTRRLQIDTKHGQVCLIPIKIVCLSPRLLSHFSSDWYMAQGHVQSLRCMDVLLLDLFRGELLDPWIQSRIYNEIISMRDNQGDDKVLSNDHTMLTLSAAYAILHGHLVH
ncbi:uncharacterized protein LOC119275110 isoform X2 [Triticum dicoccoides]|uniref:uncharacterized protein LOC119275110 isoform X2 n=1 Tax=Triticum dicoccoides TaxID=85692 RepID=UPI00188E4441|nr:uncharacterized protein LOC119275110 isoform X2 [Triticum dicoccoides]